MPLLFDRLGASHTQQFKLLGALDDIHKAIKYKYLALILTPSVHQDMPNRLIELGASFGDRFQRLGDLDDLKKGIRYESRALDSTPDGHPSKSHFLAKLGTLYAIRYQRLGELRDCEKAIEYKSLALALTPSDHPYLPTLLGNLGGLYCVRFKRMGELDCIEKAIEYQSRAIASTPNNHPNLPTYFNNLGLFYRGRFMHLGEMNDLEKAIEHISRALALTPHGHVDSSDRIGNLGASYGDRFRRLNESDDLEKAIEYTSSAIGLVPKSHPNLPNWLSYLGTLHMDRFTRLDRLDDLGKSIEYSACALNSTPIDHPDLLRRLAQVGASYHDRFVRLRELDDLLKAIEFESRALTLTPYGHPALPWLHFSQAESHFLHYQHTSDSSHLQHSLHSFRMASQSPTGAPRDKFKYSYKWARLASTHSALSCIEAYQTTLDLLPQFIWLGATTNQRYQDLRTSDTLAVEAASAAIRSSDYPLALEWLEHGRCVVWNQSLTLRSPLDQLQSVDPDLSTRLQLAANQLHQAGSEPRESRALAPGLYTPEQVAQKHRRLAKEYDELLAQARKLPNLEDFLRPAKVDALVRAARNGPIVVINCHKDHCDALLILPKQDEVHSIPLPNFTQEIAERARSEMQKSLEYKGYRERRPLLDWEPGDEGRFGEILKLLWQDLVKPVLDFLGYANNIPTGDIPHITWCPTGVISFLPLHAAGDYDQPQSRIFDYVISSYTPTLTALLASTPSSLGPNSRILAIGQEATPGHGRLPGTTKELEYMELHTQNGTQYSQLVNNQATTTVVLDAMEQHDWVHLACHAHQNVGNATESGFFLHDGILDLASINRRSFKNKGLAFLSACQTAQGDEKLPDEAVHLASGMLIAGYTSVIATMWSVRDDDAPLVADKVYGQLMQNGKLGNGEAGRALHNAVAALRDEVGVREFERWVPYIHIGS
ncbi:hypothetical protein FRC11_000757 [Ceratobasidium sp. 423]|nr:hypothetical protein FRC11_000757 [Ceratobasidium sp. 423]